MDLDVEEGEVTSSSEAAEDEVVLEMIEAQKPMVNPRKCNEPKGTAPLVNFIGGEPAPVPVDDEFDYVILERPKVTAVRRGSGGPNVFSASVSSVALKNDVVQLQAPESHRQEQAPTTAAASAAINDDLYDKESSSDSSGDGSDSDDGAVFKRYRMESFNKYRKEKGKNGHQKPSAPAAQSGGQSSSATTSTIVFQQMAGQFQKQRKVNNIWSDVLLEDKVSESFGGISVEPGCLADRGSESYFRYNPSRGKYNPRKRKANSKEGETGEDTAIAGSDETTNDDPGYISESGISEYSYNILKENKLEEMEDPLYEKTKAERNTYWRKFETEVKSFRTKQLSNFIIRRLNEPKKHLISRSIALLGKDFVIKLFMKTLKINENGGIYVVNRQRKRTIGGIYLYLLRGYPGLDPETVDKIFDEQTTANKEKTKARKQKYKSKQKLDKKAQNDVKNSDPPGTMQVEDTQKQSEPAAVNMEESID